MKRLVVAALVLVMALGWAAVAHAAGLPGTDFGANATFQVDSASGDPSSPSEFPLGLNQFSQNGGSYARYFMDDAPGGSGVLPSNSDQVVQQLAEDNLTLYPVLGLCGSTAGCHSGRSTGDGNNQYQADSTELDTYIGNLIARYGPSGSYWSQNPSVPKHPITRFEIGNEPNFCGAYTTTKICWGQPQDQTNLHYTDSTGAPIAADFAYVYSNARTTIHNLEPGGVAVFGGVVSESTTNVGNYLSGTGLSGSQIDALGYHPYLYNLNLLEADTWDLRSWMNHAGWSAIPLDINEFGYCYPGSNSGCNSGGDEFTTAQWGNLISTYAEFALCTPSLNVANVQPYWWGGHTGSDADFWYHMQHNPTYTNGAWTAGALFDMGTEWLAKVKSLTSSGCPHTLGWGGASQVTPSGISTVPNSPPTATSWNNGSEDLYWRDADNGAEIAYIYPGVNWTYAGELPYTGGQLASAPSAVNFPVNNVSYVFYQSGSASLSYVDYVNGTWQPPTVLGSCCIAGQPEATIYGTGLNVFARGGYGNNGLWIWWYYQGAWNGPDELPGTNGQLSSTSTIAAVTIGTEEDVFWENSSGLLEDSIYTPSTSWQDPVTPTLANGGDEFGANQSLSGVVSPVGNFIDLLDQYSGTTYEDWDIGVVNEPSEYSTSSPLWFGGGGEVFGDIQGQPFGAMNDGSAAHVFWITNAGQSNTAVMEATSPGP